MCLVLSGSFRVAHISVADLRDLWILCILRPITQRFACRVLTLWWRGLQSYRGWRPLSPKVKGVDPPKHQKNTIPKAKFMQPLIRWLLHSFSQPVAQNICLPSPLQRKQLFDVERRFWAGVGKGGQSSKCPEKLTFGKVEQKRLFVQGPNGTFASGTLPPVLCGVRDDQDNTLTDLVIVSLVSVTPTKPESPTTIDSCSWTQEAIWLKRDPHRCWKVRKCPQKGLLKLEFATLPQGKKNSQCFLYWRLVSPDHPDENISRSILWGNGLS